MVRYMCPVCGYFMEDAPDDYNICPCCGTEFGNHDVNTTIQNLRIAWLRSGARWWSTVDATPPDWDPYAQLNRLMGGLSLGFFGLHPQVLTGTGQLATGLVPQAVERAGLGELLQSPRVPHGAETAQAA